MTAIVPDEFTFNLRSLAEFEGLALQNPWLLDDEIVRRRVQQIRSRDVQEPLTGAKVPAGQLLIDGENFRETLVWRGRNSRHRAVMAAIDNYTWKQASRRSLDVYAPEAVTPFAAMMKKLYPRFVGSEYSEDPAAKKASLRNIRIEDLQRLTFPDRSFDVVCSNDVLEHVPDIDACLREVIRVMRSGGVFISTHPFYYDAEVGVKRAEIVDGRLVHREEPEYHSNPVDPKGSLVFEVPGWDIVERARRAGASDAYIRASGSLRHAFLGAECACIYMTVIHR